MVRIYFLFEPGVFLGMKIGNQGGRLSVGGVAEVCRIFSVFDSVVSGNSLSVGSSTRMGSVLSVAADSHVIIDQM